jgi:hypothetical protein
LNKVCCFKFDLYRYALVTNDDITRFAKLFGDEFTLDHISRGQLANMCKFVGLSPYGTVGKYV